jgi:hypothetical protein
MKTLKTRSIITVLSLATLLAGAANASQEQLATSFESPLE